MAGINFVRRWVMSQMKKTSDDGIMITLPDKNKVDLNVNITMDRLLRNGIDPNQITSPQQVDNAINMINSRMVERAIPANSAEGREITEKLFGKQKAPVFDLEGNRIPEGSGIMGGKSIKNLMDSGQVSKGARGMKKSKKVQDREMFQAANKRLTSDVDSIIKNIKSMEPMDAMKEANSVIGRKGKYKNLTPEESKKILKDTEDHIFERDIPDEDFAKGGRAGYKEGKAVLDQALALASVPYNFGKGIIGNVSDPGAVTDVSLTGAQKNFLDDIVESKGTPTGTIDYSDYGGPTKTFSGISGMDPMQASLATTMGGTGYSTNPDGSINYTGGGYDFNKGNVVTDFIDAGGILGAVDRLGDGAIGKFGESVYDTFNPEETTVDPTSKNSFTHFGYEEDPYAGIEGQTAFLDPVSAILGIGKLAKGAKASALAKQFLKNKARNYVTEKIVKPQIEKTVKKIKKTTSPIITSGGDGGGYTPTTTSQNVSRTESRVDSSGNVKAYGLRDGGRAAFMAGGMGRRGFLKMLAGLGGGIAAAKTGLLKLAGKEPAKQVAKEVVKQSAGTPPPYFFKLAEKIKTLGDDATATTDRTIAKTLKSKDGKSTYVLEEDVTSGDTIIKKVNKEGDEMITDVEIMEFRKGEVVKGKDGKAMKTPDEYEEVTEANARIEGDVYNDPYYLDGIEIDDILREVDDIPVPKASGGIARMLGE